MTSSVGGIAASVDLRGLWAGVRDQGSRPTCLACAASDGHSAAHGLSHSLSAEYLFYHGLQQMPQNDPANGLTFDAAHTALSIYGQPDELDCPYQTKAAPWIQPPMSKLWFGGLAELTTAASIFDVLEQGVPALLGIRIVSGFLNVQTPPHIIHPAGPAAGGHAVLAVGIGRRPSATKDDLLLIRNSWGPLWGEKGHAWLPVEYLSNMLLGARTLTATHIK